MPKYLSLREAVTLLLEVVPATLEHDLVLFDLEKWVAAPWRDGRLKITGRPLNNARLGDRIEIDPHSDRDIHWHEGAGQEPRVYEREAPGRGAVTGQWRGLEITAEDLARLKEYIQGLPESENAPATPAPPAALAEVAVSGPEAAQPIPAVPAEAGGPAPASTQPPTASPAIDDQPLQPELQKRKPRLAPKAAAMLKWLDRQPELTRRRTPTFLASQYRQEHPDTCAQRYAFEVFSSPERYRDRQ